MLTMAVQSGVHGALTSSLFPSHKPFLKPFKTSTASFSHLEQKLKPISRNSKLNVLAAPEALTVTEDTPTETEDSTSTTTPEPQKEKIEVAVKQVEKPRLVLKFIWMEKNIGLALDQVIPGHGTIPLSPYFFWPRKDAWEELKTTLESKPWISPKKMIILLNQATDIINLWQQSGGNLNS